MLGLYFSKTLSQGTKKWIKPPFLSNGYKAFISKSGFKVCSNALFEIITSANSTPLFFEVL